jgi:uncharacterized protein YecT (DUF1311 family)
MKTSLPATLPRIVKPLLALALAGVAAHSAAASFDCTKAESFIEKTICSEPLLSKLDDVLAQNYMALRSADLGAPKGSLRREQLAWLAGRNRCKDVKCLVDAYRARIDETCDYGVVSGAHPQCTPAADVVADAARAGACPLNETNLLGSWQRQAGTGFFEEMAFEAEGPTRRFDSWLHQRPEVSGGSWSLNDCSILVEHPSTPALNMTFKVVGFTNGRLVLAWERHPGVATYGRIQDTSQKARRSPR